MKKLLIIGMLLSGCAGSWGGPQTESQYWQMRANQESIARSTRATQEGFQRMTNIFQHAATKQCHTTPDFMGGYQTVCN